MMFTSQSEQQTTALLTLLHLRLRVLLDLANLKGGNKHDGIASILRLRHGAAHLLNNSNATMSAPLGQHPESGNDDVIVVAAKRTAPSRTSSEVAAISLGARLAMRAVPPPQRKRVLVLSDSEFALDFFCRPKLASVVSGGAGGGGAAPRRRAGTTKRRTGGRGQAARGAGGREEAHRRSLLSLAMETPGGVLFSKVRSSSRGVVGGGSGTGGAAGLAEEEAPWDGIGFLDHDAADHLSSVTRSMANGYGGDGEGVDVMNAVQPLGPVEIAWLENSDTNDRRSSSRASASPSKSGGEEMDEGGDFWRSFEVVGSEARYHRKKRDERRKERICEMIGLVPSVTNR